MVNDVVKLIGLLSTTNMVIRYNLTLAKHLCPDKITLGQFLFLFVIFLMEMHCAFLDIFSISKNTTAGREKFRFGYWGMTFSLMK